MARIHLVCVLLFLCSLCAPSVIAAEHDMEDRSIKDTIKPLTEKINSAFAEHNMDTLTEMFHPDGYLSVEGTPLAHGLEAIRNVSIHDSGPVDRIEKHYIDVGPDEEGADYVYVLLTEKWYNKENKLIADKKLLFIWRNTDDGYKVAFLMVNSNI